MSVQTYPNVHRDYNDVSLTKIKSARFGATGPRSADVSTTLLSTSGWGLVSAMS
jgi:hypothetical protein